METTFVRSITGVDDERDEEEEEDEEEEDEAIRETKKMKVVTTRAKNLLSALNLEAGNLF